VMAAALSIAAITRATSLGGVAAETGAGTGTGETDAVH